MVVLIELIIVLMILSFVARMARGVFLFLLRKDVLPAAIVVGIVYVFVFVLDINYSVIFGQYVWPSVVFVFKLGIGVFMVCLVYSVASRMPKRGKSGNRFENMNSKMKYKGFTF